MGRRKKNSLPELRNHRGRARFRFRGREYYCGAFGSPESYAERDRIIGGILCDRPARGDVEGPPATTVAEPESLERPTPLPDRAASAPPRPGNVANQTRHAAPADGITIQELALLWLDHIERTKCNHGKHRTSCWSRARQAINALEDFWSLPASQFGTRALLAVQAKLVRTPVTSRPKDPTKKPRKRPRTRQGVNGIVSEIRAFFRFGVLMEVIAPEQADSLRAVPPLIKRQTAAPEGNGKKPVDEQIVNATLPHLTHVVADLIQFARISGCRPGEARMLRPCDIDRRPLPSYRGCWLWRVPDWKLDHLDGIIPREIWINPESQRLLAPWLARLEATPKRHVFSPRHPKRPDGDFPTSEHWNGHAPRCRRSAKQRTNDFYSKDSLNRAISRACEKHGLPAWTAGQIRHNRLTEVREKWGLDYAQAVAGHSNSSQTEHYARVRRQKALEVAVADCGP